jgi:prepilin-type N-terminal cleavage/methylation domain-containing protein
MAFPRAPRHSGFIPPPTFNAAPSGVRSRISRKGDAWRGVFGKKLVGGFTLIELLVVIAIIGVLASVILASLSSARQKGQIVKAKTELHNARSAIALLEDDTGKWPNGCTPGAAGDPEVVLDDAQAGIVARPTAGSTGSGCTWTSADVAAWKGPYMPTAKDPWGNSYHFDPDYQQYQNCATTAASDKYPTVPVFNALVSPGPTKTNPNGINDYDCDDIILKID